MNQKYEPGVLCLVINAKMPVENNGRVVELVRKLSPSESEVMAVTPGYSRSHWEVKVPKDHPPLAMIWEAVKGDKILFQFTRYHYQRPFSETCLLPLGTPDLVKDTETTDELVEH